MKNVKIADRVEVQVFHNGQEVFSGKGQNAKVEAETFLKNLGHSKIEWHPEFNQRTDEVEAIAVIIENNVVRMSSCDSEGN